MVDGQARKAVGHVGIGGSLLSRRPTVWVVLLILSPPAWMTVMDSRLVAGEVCVDGVT